MKKPLNTKRSYSMGPALRIQFLPLSLFALLLLLSGPPSLAAPFPPGMPEYLRHRIDPSRFLAQYYVGIDKISPANPAREAPIDVMFYAGTSLVGDRGAVVSLKLTDTKGSEIALPGSASESSRHVTLNAREALKGTLRFQAPQAGNLTLRISLIPDSGKEVQDELSFAAGPKMLRKRIAGQTFFDLDSKDSGDTFANADGVLVVTHDPGCGWWGNDGTDHFFTKKPLPAGCTLVKYWVYQCWPTSVDRSKAGGGWVNDIGSYNAISELDHMPPGIRWHNTCQKTFAGKKLMYAVALCVDVPEGTDIGEPTYDWNDKPCFGSFRAPAGFTIDCDTTTPYISKFYLTTKYDPLNGKIYDGDSVTVHWEVRDATPGNIGLRCIDLGGTRSVIYQSGGLQPNGSLELIPRDSAGRSGFFQYVLTAANGDRSVTSDSADGKIVVEMPSPVPKDDSVQWAWHWLRMTNSSSSTLPCFTIAWPGKDEASAKSEAEKFNPGYTGLNISESEATTACQAVGGSSK